MRIERIETIGFKSFSDKTVFNFHPGVTAIVGPNGCGKSNIVDAFRWVLGEQSAKSLRGEKMEEVIFSGSSSKKPKGMAEVNLIVSGVYSELPTGEPNSGEITVTRRLYRSGESEYLINKIPCRLKDIKDIFLDTGLELKTYSILEQGRVAEVLNSKPQDRRFLVEEAAGVMKYKIRKAEALQKLEASRSNLQRLQDIIAEVRRQINSIDRQARRAEKYKKLFNRIKDIEIGIAVRDSNSLKETLSSLKSSYERLKAQEIEYSTKLSEIEAQIERRRINHIEQEKAIEELMLKVHSTEKEITEGEGRIALLKSEYENLKEHARKLNLEDSELRSKKTSMEVRLSELLQKDADLRLDARNLEGNLETHSESFRNLEEDIWDLEEALEEERKKLFEKAESVSILKNEISNLSSQSDAINRKEDKILEDRNAIKEKITRLAVLTEEADADFLVLNSELEVSFRAKDEVLKDLNNKREDLKIEEEALYRGREEIAALTSRLDSLKELDMDKRPALKGINILYYVTDIFETQPAYDIAIEAVLGEKLTSAILDNREAVKKALSIITGNKISRSGFIPADINPMSVFSLRFPDLSPQNGGIIGKAIDLIKVKEGFENIALSLFGDVVIVNDLDTAYDLWQNNESQHCYVTLHGEVLDPSGHASGGIEKGLLRVKREIRDLDTGIREKKSSMLAREDRINSVKDSIASMEDALLALTDDITQKGKARDEVKSKINSLAQEKTRYEKQMEYVLIENEENLKEKEKIQNNSNEKTLALKSLEDEKQALDVNIKKMQNSITHKKALLESLRAELTETRLSLTALRGKIDALTKEHKGLNTSMVEIDKKLEEITKEQSMLQEGISQRETEIREKEQAIRDSVILAQQMQSEFSKMKESLEIESSNLRQMEHQRKDTASSLESVRSEVSQLKVKKTELSLKLEHIKDTIKNTYSVTLDSIEPATLEEGDEDSLVNPMRQDNDLQSLKEQLQAIGPVNLGTLEEFEELKTRYEFLSKQQADLVQSIDSLEEAISKINRTTRKKLEEAFESLNKKFKEVFTLLFGGGKAELILLEGDILDAGIDIIAQPPGKNLQNLSLLSGGEKALVALSVLFAGFMVKPTPLCILDEVDAPLDESNTERFSGMINSLSENIQFIIVTHNRRTMELADYIYGITMEEAGVSRVVSMHLTEEAVQ